MTAQQLCDKILVRLSAFAPQTMSFLEALNDVLEIVGNVVLDVNATMLETNVSVSVATGGSRIVLPDGFWGLVQQPYIYDATNGVTKLTPITDRTIYEGADAGKPEQFEVIYGDAGDTLMLYPTADATYTVKYSYNRKPSVTYLSDDIPFNGLFDAAIGDILVRVGSSGGWHSMSQDWEAVEERILQVLRTRTPRRLTLQNVKASWA